MENRYIILHTIYQLVKHEADPLSIMVQSGEVIIHQDLPWNEIGNYLSELQQEGLISIRQMNTAIILLTQKGLEHCTSPRVEEAA